ncbi:MAG TPA: DUF2721 domain-containing protein [Myxococcota bacterium]|nr:DUF2721 domain-containing protein [Myxococcota bacterium]
MPASGRLAIRGAWGAVLHESELADIGHVIQLAVAPVFLLTGVAAFLNVLTNRLARIIDRARVLEDMLGVASERERLDAERQLGALSRRARLINRSIALAVICALMICTLVALLFAGAFLGRDMRVPVGTAFVATMFALIGALLSFLREVFVATRNLRIGAGTTN